MENYKFDFLKEEYYDQYIDLYKSQKTHMKLSREEWEFDKKLAKLKENFFDNKYNVTRVAFDETGLMVAAVSVYFPPEVRSIYSHTHISRVKIDSLTTGFKVWEMMDKLSEVDINYINPHGDRGASIVYDMRELGHHRALVWARKKGYEKKLLRERRYDHYVDYIYKPGQKCKYREHSFFFHNKESFSKTMVVSMWILKNEFRDNPELYRK
jgi:hypothetical protein